jgi:hypothetical protein
MSRSFASGLCIIWRVASALLLALIRAKTAEARVRARTRPKPMARRVPMRTLERKFMMGS